MENINYKFVSKDTCLVRLGSEDVPFFMLYLKPIPTFSYRIKIINGKYIIILKISFMYLIIIGFLLYHLFIFNYQKITFNDLFALIFYLLLFIFLIIFSKIKMKKVAINFIKILRSN